MTMPASHAGERAASGSLAAQLADPCLFLVDFDFEGRAAVFSRAQPEWFHDRLRLSAYDLPLDSLVLVPLDAVLAALPGGDVVPAINYLFHLPFCGSSFLTRHLEHDAVWLLRDPAALDAVFRTKPGSEYPPFIAELRRVTLTCLNRRLGARATVVRTAGYYPAMIEALIQSPTMRSALLLYSSPEHYLLQVLKSAERRRHVRLLMTSELSFVAERTGQLLDTLPDVVVAALFWVRYAQTVLGIGAERLRSLDCEQLFADPDHALDRVSTLFAIDTPGWRGDRAQQLRSIHAKSGESFSTEQRAAVLDQARAAYASELAAAQEILVAADADALLAGLEAMSI